MLERGRFLRYSRPVNPKLSCGLPGPRPFRRRVRSPPGIRLRHARFFSPQAQLVRVSLWRLDQRRAHSFTTLALLVTWLSPSLSPCLKPRAEDGVIPNTNGLTREYTQHSTHCSRRHFFRFRFEASSLTKHIALWGRAGAHAFFLRGRCRAFLYSPPFPCLTVVGRERGAGTSSTQIVVRARE